MTACCVRVRQAQKGCACIHSVWLQHVVYKKQASTSCGDSRQATTTNAAIQLFIRSATAALLRSRHVFRHSSRHLACLSVGWLVGGLVGWCWWGADSPHGLGARLPAKRRSSAGAPAPRHPPSPSSRPPTPSGSTPPSAARRLAPSAATGSSRREQPPCQSQQRAAQCCVQWWGQGACGVRKRRVGIGRLNAAGGTTTVCACASSIRCSSTWQHNKRSALHCIKGATLY
jgi:hypothetical protein